MLHAESRAEIWAQEPQFCQIFPLLYNLLGVVVKCVRFLVFLTSVACVQLPGR